MTFQMSEYSLSVNDEALHPVLLSDDISWPDIITKRDEENAHISDTSHCFDKDEDILYSVCTEKAVQDSHSYASSETINKWNVCIATISLVQWMKNEWINLSNGALKQNLILMIDV